MYNIRWRIRDMFWAKMVYNSQIMKQDDVRHWFMGLMMSREQKNVVDNAVEECVGKGQIKDYLVR